MFKGHLGAIDSLYENFNKTRFLIKKDDPSFPVIFHSG
jgi:hypothetical protein